MGSCAYCSQALPGTVSETGNLGLAACPDCFNVNLIAWENGSPGARTLDGFDDIASRAPSGSVMAGVLKSVGEAIRRLPVLPEVPRRVVTLVHDPISSMRDVALMVTDDAGLSLRILNRANSAAYSPVSAIKDVGQACAQLGMKSIAQIAQTEMSAGLFRSVSEPAREISSLLWRHSVVAAFCAERLAHAAKVPDPDRLFLAGLVHDVGKLVLMDAILNVHRGRVGRLAQDRDLLGEVLEQFGPWVGAQVVQFWKMPDDYLSSTFFSAHPDRVPSESWRQTAHLVALASDMAAALGYDLGASSIGHTWEDHASRAPLGLAARQVASLQEEMAESASGLSDLLNLS